MGNICRMDVFLGHVGFWVCRRNGVSSFRDGICLDRIICMESIAWVITRPLNA